MATHHWALGALLLGLHAAAHAQDASAVPEEIEGRHVISLFTGNSWVPEGRSPTTGGKEMVIAPTFGLDYEYKLSEKWSIGTYNDLEIMNIAVENEVGELIQRENTLLLSIGASYEVFPRFAVEASAGVETDANETLRVGRFGAEYAIPLPKSWELGIGASYVNKDIYDVFCLGLSIGRRFGK